MKNKVMFFGLSDLEDLQRLLLARLDAIGPAPRPVLLYALKLRDHERARRISDFYDDPGPRRSRRS